jgi:hypothetical protein
LDDGEEYSGDSVKVALNIARLRGSDVNVLPELLRRGFGRDAGQPRTHQIVFFEPSDGRLELQPVHPAAAESGAVEERG